MKKARASLNVRDRLLAAITLYKNEYPGGAIQISKLCRMAGVNRSNIYTSHSDLLDGLRPEVSHRKIEAATAKQRANESNEELVQLRKQNKALLYLCVELQASLFELEVRNGAKTVLKKNK